MLTVHTDGHRGDELREILQDGAARQSGKLSYADSPWCLNDDGVMCTARRRYWPARSAAHVPFLQILSSVQSERCTISEIVHDVADIMPPHDDTPADPISHIPYPVSRHLKMPSAVDECIPFMSTQHCRLPHDSSILIRSEIRPP